MGKIYSVKEEVRGKKVVVTEGIQPKAKQVEYSLHASMSDLEIRRMVQRGVDISHFEATDQKDKDAMKNLARLIDNSKAQKISLIPTVHTKLVRIDGQGKVIENPATKVPDQSLNIPEQGVSSDDTDGNTKAIGYEEFKGALLQHGIDLSVVKSIYDADEESFKGLVESKEVKDAIKFALAVKGNFGAAKLYSLLNGNK